MICGNIELMRIEAGYLKTAKVFMIPYQYLYFLEWIILKKWRRREAKQTLKQKRRRLCRQTCCFWVSFLRRQTFQTSVPFNPVSVIISHPYSEIISRLDCGSLGTKIKQVIVGEEGERQGGVGRSRSPPPPVSAPAWQYPNVFLFHLNE